MCACSYNEVVELLSTGYVDAKGLQRFKKSLDTLIKEKSVSGWQVLEVQMAITDAWPPSALLIATHFGCCWRRISSGMTALCLNDIF